MNLISGASFGQIAKTFVDWSTPLFASRVVFIVTDGAAALVDLKKWNEAQQEPRTRLVYVSSNALPRVDLGSDKRVSSQIDPAPPCGSREYTSCRCVLS